MAEEREGLKQRQAESEFRQKEFDFRQKQYQNTFVDLGLPLFTDPVTKERKIRRWNPYTNEIRGFGVPGTAQFGVKEIKEYIGHQDKEFQSYLNNLAEAEVARNPDDPGKAFDKLEATAEKMPQEKISATKKTGTKADALAGLDALEQSLHGGMGQPGLLDTKVA